MGDKFAVFDMDREYIEKFSSYVSHKENFPFQFAAYSDIEVFIRQYKNVEVLLVSDQAMRKEELKKAIDSRKNGKVVLLTEERYKEKIFEYPAVYKYQSIENILREVFHHCASAGSEVEYVEAKKTEFIGVYSPVAKSIKTAFAFTVGYLLSKEMPVLYLNFEKYSGMEEILEKEYDFDVGDIMYFLGQKTGDIRLKIESSVCVCHGVDYIPSAGFRDDLYKIPFKEWKRLLEQIKKETKYQRVVLDLGEGLESLNGILSLCSRIYVPLEENALSKRKVREFKKDLEEGGEPGILNRLKDIKIPENYLPAEGEEFLEEIILGRIGGCVQKLLKEEGSSEHVRI